MPIESPYEAELAVAKALFDAELIAGGYEDEGEREGVNLSKKPDLENPYGVPIVKGECVLESITKEEFLACIQLPGMRKRWDPRFDDGFILDRYSRHSYSFYSAMKGMSWLVYARDIAGVQKNYYSQSGDEIIVIQTSVVHAKAPELTAESKTRATLSVSGWQLSQQGSDLQVTYIVKISLNGSIPFALVNMIATETPLCIARARDVGLAIGHAPYVSTESTTAVVEFQTESFSDPPAAGAADSTLEYRCSFTTNPTASFCVTYSTRMYPNGILAVVEGAGTEVKDDGAGTVTVTCVGGEKENVVLVISPAEESE